MENSRKSNFMRDIDARQYSRNQNVVQINSQNRVNPNIRSNNMYPQHKRNVRNSVRPSRKRYNRIITRGTVAITALLAATLITGAVSSRNTNKNIDNVHAAYAYTENVLATDERTINKEGYQDYIDIMAAFDKTFELSNKEEFHDFAKDLGIEDIVLDSEQITNLALEVFKVAFGEKYGVDPMSVTVKHVEPNIVTPQEDFNYNTGRYNYTSISYTASNGETEKIEKDYLEKGYFAYGVFEPNGSTIQYRNDIPETEYDIINSIVNAQTDEKDIKKALKALKLAQEYATKIKDDKSIAQSDGPTASYENDFPDSERA